MNVFQKAADWIKSRKTPGWLKRIFGIAQDMIVDALSVLGEEAVNFLKSQIFIQAQAGGTGEDKFKNVVSAFRKKYKDFDIKDSMLNLAIEILVGVLKKEGLIPTS